MKKIIIASLLVIVLCGNFLLGCKDDKKPGGGGGGDIVIDVPTPDEIITLPGKVEMPAKPTLPEVNPQNAPYLAKVGTTTSAYTLTEKKSGDNLTGVTVQYGNSEKVLEDFNFIYFDVYNYSAEYKNIRFDFENINGAEKIAVSAMYIEQYENGNPPVGVMVESLMDGAISFVTKLSDYKTIDGKYEQMVDKLSDKTVARLIVYIDTNPAQAPIDKVGSLDITGVKFLKDGDPLIKVDNSPKIKEITPSLVYNLTTTATNPNYTNVFKAEYKTNSVPKDSFVEVKVDRFVGAYGTLNISYLSNNARKLTILDDENKVINAVNENGDRYAIENYDLKIAEDLVLDLREYTSLKSVKFCIDSTESSIKNDTARIFELKSMTFLYTPYATDSWSATSKFTVSDGGLGGKVKASYDETVGWDFLSVQVKYWTKDYSEMVAKFKISGADGGAKRYGLSVNSNKVILELEHNTIADLEFDAMTGEYIMKVDLSSISKLTALNFYFDSQYVDSFSGKRNVEFTSINFIKAPDTTTISKMKANPGYSVANGVNGADISWTAEKTDYTYVSVSKYKAEFTQLGFTVTNNGDNAIKISVYKGNYTDLWLDTTIIQPHITKDFTIDVPNAATQKESFKLYFFWSLGEPVAGNVTVSNLRFFTETVAPTTAVGEIKNFSNAKYDITSVTNGTKIAWTETRSTWDYCVSKITHYTTDYKFLKVEATPNKSVKLGVYNGATPWLNHTVLSANKTTTFYLNIVNASAIGSTFDISFYFDGGITSSSEIILKLDILREKPIEDTGVQLGTLVDLNNEGYTITDKGSDTFQVVWSATKTRYAKAQISVSNYSKEYKYLVLTFTNATESQVGVWQADNDAMWKIHTKLSLGSSQWVIEIPNAETIAENFNINFYFDGYLDTTLGGNVTMKIELKKTNGGVSGYDKTVNDIGDYN